ncbi:MAG TPA: hypothetical protein VKK79_09635 [Candidatus Lokiarchaeia archaeon]|nr:hypothetical protein [Candidatus Lokiarchaeia archaeon]
MSTEEFGKVGSKGELYPSAKIRKQLNLIPNMRVKYRISPAGYLIVEPVLSVEELLKLPRFAKVSFEEIEKLSEKMQDQGSEDAD